LRQDLAFEDPVVADRGDAEPAMIVDVDGFAGPLDLLLELARRQKVDLHKISVLALAEQYLDFIDIARRFRLELAADYLVMAAWLAFLKSRLLLPEPAKAEGEEVPAAELAAQLAYRLRRLEATRENAKRLYLLHRLGRDVFARGAPEPVVIEKHTHYEASLYDLLKAYSEQRQIKALSSVTFERRFVWSLPEAREALERLIGQALDWTALDHYLVDYVVEPAMRATVRASAFSAMLEMVREGLVDIRQDRAFAPLEVRARRKDGPARSGGEA
jgi:segregation and condensation protein A